MWSYSTRVVVMTTEEIVDSDNGCNQCRDIHSPMKYLMARSKGAPSSRFLIISDSTSEPLMTVFVMQKIQRKSEWSGPNRD